MVLPHRNSVTDGHTISGMSVYNEDSTGRRIAWARKNVDWVDAHGEHRIGMTGRELGRRLVTQGTVTGVRNVYVSQLENNHASPSLPMLRKIAEVTGVTVGFLLMETDYPYRNKHDHEPEPVYFSPEADAVAKLVDDAPPDERVHIAAVVRAMVTVAKQVKTPAPTGGSYTPEQPPATPNGFARKLIDSDRVGRVGNVVRA